MFDFAYIAIYVWNVSVYMHVKIDASRYKGTIGPIFRAIPRDYYSY